MGECTLPLLLSGLALLIFVIALTSMNIWAVNHGSYHAEDSAAAARIKSWSIGFLVTAIIVLVVSALLTASKHVTPTPTKTAHA